MEQNHQLKMENQMEFMMMMQQIERIPEFCSAYNELSAASGFHTSSDISTPEPHCFDNFQAVDSSSPPFMKFPSLATGSTQEPAAQAAKEPFPATSRWRSSVNLGGENSFSAPDSQKQSSVAAMREMIFRIAVMQPIHIDPESVKPPKRRNVKISTDPQSVAARHRRERISERIRILQRLVPGGTKMDTASMLDEAIHYVKFLKTEVQSLERIAANRPISTPEIGFPLEMSSGSNVHTKKPSRMRQNVDEFGDA